MPWCTTSRRLANQHFYERETPWLHPTTDTRSARKSLPRKRRRRRSSRPRPSARPILMALQPITPTNRRPARISRPRSPEAVRSPAIRPRVAGGHLCAPVCAISAACVASATRCSASWGARLLWGGYGRPGTGWRRLARRRCPSIKTAPTQPFAPWQPSQTWR